MANSSGVVGVLRALLTADTAQFDTSMRKSAQTAQQTTKALDGLGKEVTQLTPQAERMVKAFGGDKLLATANNLTAAVAKIGGAARLTEAEQKRLNGTITQAIEKYRALGIQAPRSMVDLERATRSAGGSTDWLQAKMVGLGAAVGVFASNVAMGAVRSLVAYGKGAFDAANNLLDLSAKTDFSTDALQRMQFVGNKIGVSLETMSDSAFRLSANIAGGDKSVAFAVDKLGLNLASLQAMRPEQQFETIVQALHNVEDAGARNRLGIQLFGRSFNEIAAAVAQNYKDMADAATVNSRAQLEALSRQQQIWNEFTSNLKTSTMGVVADLIVMAEAWQLAKAPTGQGWAETIEAYKRIRAELERGNIELPAMTRHVLDLNMAQDQAAKSGDGLAAQFKREMAAANELAESIARIEQEMFVNRVTMEQKSADEQERIAQNTAKQQLETFLALNQSIIGLDAERMRTLLAANAPGTNLRQVTRQAGASIGDSMKEGIGRAFEQVPHFLTSSIIHSGSFINGLKAIGVDMADAIVEPLIKRFIAQIAGARIGSALAGATALGGAAATAGTVAAGAGAAAAGTAAAAGGIGAGAAAAGAGGAGAGAAAAGAGGLGSSLVAFATNPLTIAAAAGIAGVLLFRHFRDSTNDKRDKFLAQFSGFDTSGDKADTANPPGFHGLDRYLSKYKHHDWFTALAGARDGSSLKNIENVIAGFVGSQGRTIKSFAMGGFVPPGMVQPAILHGGAYGETITPAGPSSGTGWQIVNHWHVSTIDEKGIRQFVDSGEFTHHLGAAFERNQNFLTTKLRRAL